MFAAALIVSRSLLVPPVTVTVFFSGSVLGGIAIPMGCIFQSAPRVTMSVWSAMFCPRVSMVAPVLSDSVQAIPKSVSSGRSLSTTRSVETAQNSSCLCCWMRRSVCCSCSSASASGVQGKRNLALCWR